MIFKPHLYQEYARDWIIEKPTAALFLDMGLGKTVCTLTALQELMHNYFDVARVLVIAPLRVARDTWSGEKDKWDQLKYFKISKVLGKPKVREAALKDVADTYVINRENLEWLVDYVDKKWCFDMVVVDELSSFKSPRSKRFKALKRVRTYIKRILGLTGTPAPNGLLDLWSQIYLPDGGLRLERTLQEYRSKYFEPMGRKGSFIFSWSLELYQQANARFHRQGQEEHVVVNHIIARRTIDEDVMRVLQKKEGRQEDLLEAVKARLKRRNSWNRELW